MRPSKDAGDASIVWVFFLAAFAALIFFAGCVEYVNVGKVAHDAGKDARCRADSLAMPQWPFINEDVIDSLFWEFEVGLFEGLAVECER